MKILKLDDRQAPRRKHVPQRTCVACRSAQGKRELVRLVAAAGGVQIDSRGKMPGRGVYLCPNRQCWEKGLKSNRIEYGLRTRLTDENRQALDEYCQALPDKED